MAFLLKAMGFSDAIPNFPFTPIDASSAASSSSSSSSAPFRAVVDITQRHVGCSSNYSVQMVNGVTWTVQQGKSTEDKKQLVSIFTCHYGHNTRTADLARNMLKRAKSLVLPGFLKVHGGADYHDTIHIATDPCVPLKQVLALPAARHFFFSAGYHTEEDNRLGVAEDTLSFRESLALGLRSVAGALNSLHRNHLIHGNVCADTVFVVSSSGAWKLFGLELVSTAAEPNSLYYTNANTLLPRGRVPPEVQQNRQDLIPSLNVGHADAWGLGLLIAQSAGVSAAEASQGRLDDVEAQAGSSGTFLSPSQVANQLPKDLQPTFKALTNQSPQSRMTLPQFLDSCALITMSQLVHTVAELEEISLRDPGQRERFFEQLNTASLNFPFRFCLCTLVAKLAESLQTGVVANVVQPIVRVASRMPKAPRASAAADATTTLAGPVKLVNYDFDVYITPALTTLFQSSDNLLRYRLLEHAALYGPHIPTKTASEVIWPLYARGFTSQTSSVREYSARALVHLAPQFSPTILQHDVPQAISTLQRDGDGAIRTNATICLCLLAQYLPEAGRGVVLMNGFCRMLKDPFAPSRIAALRSLTSTVRYMETAQLAQSVLPAVCPLAIDSDAEARGCALSILQSSLEKLQSADTKRRQEEANRPVGVADGASASSTPVPSTSAAAGGQAQGSFISGISSWMGGGGGTGAAPAPAASSSSSATAAAAAATYSKATPILSSATTTTNNNKNAIGSSSSAAGASLMPSSAFSTHTDPTALAPASSAIKSGWSDDEADDGWQAGGGGGGGAVNMDDLFMSSSAQSRMKPMNTGTGVLSGTPANTRTANAPSNPSQADFSSLFDGMTMGGGARAGAVSSTPSSTPSSTGMKLRGKKSGGFGATRL